MPGPTLLNWMIQRRESMLADLATLVVFESPSRDKAVLDPYATMLAGRFEALGGNVKLIDNPAGGNHVDAWFYREGDLPPALVLAHFDTVWPLGTVVDRPFRVDGPRAYGPGSYDMKASIILFETALAAFQALGLTPRRPIHVLVTSDEEIGSPTSRAHIEAAARECAHALVLEPPLPGGLLKTARKGVGGFTVEIEGKAAHAGVEPEKGISAINELALQIPRINALANPSVGTTINVGLISGGTTPNVVPAQAMARVDVRVATMDEARRLEHAFRGLHALTPGASVNVSGGINRPPMERTTASRELFERTRQIGRSLGLELDEGSTGGGSDGNFTAALGVATLDGLGVPGAGAHALNEHILIDSLPERAALLACLLLEL
ncbi:glutamate carboxypeptidase [Singulisphaera sp. GP187]|uniref:M20 family metallopeptidase n=1 Tax=Singulisphaera sp. GP187 TaxID=1882752 RepID=UPI00092910F5|nr:M20 family metallopeptidase [Singulisphaera sp. GP187]SIN89841.1 glutamate carboxypeptidase [Singulisphaera sp. GP187]